MSRFTYYLCFLLMLISFAGYTQTIQGNVRFIDDRTNFRFIGVRIGEDTAVQCDSLGFFSLNGDLKLDTVTITPFPVYIQVKFCNIPSDLDTVTLSDIPLFADVISGHPIISFKTKRASKKYFRKEEKKQQEEKSELKSKIASYRYHWMNQEYELIYLEKGETNMILIDLGSPR